MSHIDELTMMMYVDQELCEEESAAVKKHISVCPSCQQASLFWLADHAFFRQSFVNSSSPASPPELQPYVKQQIDAISALHRKSKQRFYASRWLFLLIPFTFLIIIQILLVNWLNQMSAIWEFLWESAFWLREQATSWHMPSRHLLPALFLASLLIMLVILNYRRSDYFHGEHADGGFKHD